MTGAGHNQEMPAGSLQSEKIQYGQKPHCVHARACCRFSCVPLFATPWTSPGKNTGVGCHALLQGILPTQGSNPGLQHCRRILYWLSHQGISNTNYPPYWRICKTLCLCFVYWACFFFFFSFLLVCQKGIKHINQMTIISTTVGKNPFEELE